jgi:hypothetical protein
VTRPRPKRPGGRPRGPGPSRVVRVPADAFARLLRIAEDLDLRHGGHPSAGRAVVRLLEERDQQTDVHERSTR